MNNEDVLSELKKWLTTQTSTSPDEVSKKIFELEELYPDLYPDTIYLSSGQWGARKVGDKIFTARAAVASFSTDDSYVQYREHNKTGWSVINIRPAYPDSNYFLVVP
jgi:hypothetical protein